MKAPWIVVLMTALACSPTSDELEPGSVSIRDGKSDGSSEVSLSRSGRYIRVDISGDAAVDLWNVMENAGGFDEFEERGLDYLAGARMICASNGSAAGCAILSRFAESDGDYLATIHGRRFDSAASELFGAIARANGTPPATVAAVESDRFECAKNSRAVWCGVTEAGGRALELAFAGLEDLGDDYVYEGWLITDDGPITSGRFSISDPDEPHTFTLSSDLVEKSSLFVLTIEPARGDDPAPAATHVLAGAFDDGMAILGVDHPAALGTDFEDADGSYILETPTTGANTSDYRNGVWFVDPEAGKASLDLPELPEGWAYEGWVVGSDGPISTGRFRSVDGADSDGAGPNAGPDGFPPFPGQDFIDPSRDLRGHAVVISVEPEPDNSPGPFALKPLVDSMVDDLGRGTLEAMGNNAAASNPSGVAAWR